MYAHESLVEVAADGRVPPEVQQGVFERVVAEDAAAAKRSGRLQRRVGAIAEDYRARLRERLGERKYAGLREYMDDVRQARARAADDTSASRSDAASRAAAAAAARARRRAESLATIERLGIRAADLKRLGARTHRRIARLLTKPETAAAEGTDVGRLLQPRDVPSAVRERKTNPWTIVTPPYPAQGRHTDGYADGVTYSKVDHLDRVTGLVGSKVNLDDPSASDIDAASKEYHTRVGFWYQMPATGLVEVWIEAQSAFSRHALVLDDEFGWSTADVYQAAYLTLQTVVAGQADKIRRSEISVLEKDGETDGSWETFPLTDGHTYWTHLFSTTPYKPGTWVWVRAGASNYNYVLTNDVEVHSALDFRWFFKSVHVEAS